ncbi:MAG: hypothetical protein JKX80_01795 [Candidatus Pacebacteria bacterium]|nr:hypothetical protein [Candidatus Paceibacterota bacterium]
MNDVVVDNERLISTTQASKVSGYSKDYVGQLCREEKMFCRRISGHWYVSENSLKSYQGAETKNGGNHPEKKKIPSSEKTAYGMKVGNVRDDTFSYDGVEYISTLRGAELTGYAQDYIGQLARNGEIEARKVGRRWFIGRETLTDHKKHNDGLLAAVQSQSSGVLSSSEGRESTAQRHVDVDAEGAPVAIEIHTNVEPGDINFNVRYVSETNQELVPKMLPKGPVKNIYAPGDIDKVPFGHVASGDSDILTKKRGNSLKQVSNNTSRLGVERSSHVSSKEIAFVPSTIKSRRGFSGPSVVRLFIFLLAAAFVAYAYLFGPPELLESIIPIDFFSTLKDSYGEFLPGAEFEYQAQ